MKDYGCFEKEADTPSATQRISGTRFHASPQETVPPGMFVGVLGSSEKTQLCDHIVTMCCNSGVSFLCMFCVFYCSHWAYGTLSFGDFKGGENLPW